MLDLVQVELPWEITRSMYLPFVEGGEMGIVVRSTQHTALVFVLHRHLQTITHTLTHTLRNIKPHDY